MVRKLFSAAVVILALASCSASRERPVELWTDLPEFVSAVELFNASQKNFILEIQWKTDLAAALEQAKAKPALVVGRYLSSRVYKDRMQPLNAVLGEGSVPKAAFYPSLLALGNSGGRQLVLPLSFNLPALVFAKDSIAAGEVGDGFLLGLSDIEKVCVDYNSTSNGSFVRMGFSPRWFPGFLTRIVSAGGADFGESKPLRWNDAGLAESVKQIRSWLARVNGPAAREDDFQFKYLYTPAYQYAAAGRSLFAYMGSADFFLVPEEKRAGLDYRWFSVRGAIPVLDSVIFAGMPRGGQGRAAAKAFLRWFYKEESQQAMLADARRSRSIESSFGLIGGFSAIRAVNEKVFPIFYPALVGHLPSAEALSTAGALPVYWPELEKSVIAPWLALQCSRAPQAGEALGRELAEKIAEYQRQGRPR